ncbi:glycoside hydrolase family 78 protein [Bombilactobacillus folatiphilus]|uniref:alpha-L-rhamnosidase n=1 Tax=Bombilactobacillus folatiphilus TaxID=2923362 RepID=A0ABY4P9R6_9LACO|nr:alpha-L-rhamnosidase [Bombilactobacillus folatiphilus]UQS82284.1 glycoside hydrolase family 78 protein [Bombilactobacillus folatiphilus]
MQITKILVNHMQQPLGFELQDLRVEFQLQATGTLPHTLKKHLQIYQQPQQKLVYESNWSTFPTNYFVPDCSLQPRTRYMVKIQVHADQDLVTGESWFETGKMNEPFQADFIGHPDQDVANTLLQKQLTIQKPVRQARLYITGLGLYETYIDQQKVGDEFLTPGVTAYDQFVQVQTYDVTQALQVQGDHQLLISCGDGWYKGNFGFDGGQDCIYGNRQMALAEYHLDYEDGTHEVITTDADWQTTVGQITKSAIYYGEDYDATKPVTDWQPAVVVEQTKAVLADRLSLPITINQQLSPELLQTPAGEQVLDFKQNQAGWIEFYNREPKGTKLNFEMGEILQDGNFYRDNLREARAAFTYVSDGKEQWVRPHFTYFGYRYVRVQGNTQPLQMADFKADVLYSKMQETGVIQTNNALVNRLFQNIIWGQRSNFMDVPTDCPQRDERLGWSGDAEIFSNTATYNMNVFAFFKKYAHDMALEQKQNDGMLPMYAPAMGQSDGGSAVWADAATIIPWNMYQAYGDPAILHQNYPQMKAWVDWISLHTTTPNLWTGTFQFGDWLALDGENPAKPTGKTDEDFIASVYYYYSTSIVAKTAQLLHEDQDAKDYSVLAQKIKMAIRQEYITETGRVAINAQTAYALTLYFDLVTPEQRKHVVADLVQRLQLDGNHLQTGFVGTPYLCQVLSANGQHKLATQIFLNEDFPSWLYAVKLGATTVWERWNSVEADGSMNPEGMNSLNHYSIGTIMEWAYKYLLGIKEHTAGFASFTFAPQFDYRLPQIQGHFDSPYGDIQVQTAIETDAQHTIQIQLSVPIGTSAQIELPRSASQTIRVNDQEYQSDQLTLTAGRYEISYQPTQDYVERYQAATPLREIMVDEQLVAQIDAVDPVLNFFKQNPQEVAGGMGSMSLTEANITFPFINVSEEHLAKINQLLIKTPILSERKQGKQ